MNKAGFSRLPLLAALLSLIGCGGLAPPEFGSNQPRFEPEKFFAGHVQSWGVIENRSGDPSRAFTTNLQGRTEGPDLVMDQRFAFADGQTERRVWHLRRLDAHRYEATADDVVGTATGEAYGNAFRLEYTLALAPGNPLKNVHMKQWMYAVGDGSMMMNRVEITKLGVSVAQATEFFAKQPD